MDWHGRPTKLENNVCETEDPSLEEPNLGYHPSARFSILKSIRRDFVDALPLPARLKAYLNTPHYYSEELADSVTLSGGALAVQSQELQSGLQEEPFSPSW